MNICGMYDKLWGPSQRVVTLLLSETTIIPSDFAAIGDAEECDSKKSENPRRDYQQ